MQNPIFTNSLKAGRLLVLAAIKSILASIPFSFKKGNNLFIQAVGPSIFPGASYAQIVIFKLGVMD